MKLLYEPSPDRDWHLRLSDHQVSRDAEFIDHLARIPGLSSATVDGDDVRLVTQEEGGSLSEPALLQAAETVGARVAAILLPESARISVLTMTASGGG